MTAFWWGSVCREAGIHPQGHGGHSALPTCTRLSPNSQAGPAPSHGVGHGRDPGAVSQSRTCRTSTLQGGDTALLAWEGAGEGSHRVPQPLQQQPIMRGN